MTSLSPLSSINDLYRQAGEISSVRPDVAEAINRDVSTLLGGMAALTVAEAANELGQSSPTIRSWIRAGLLPAQRLGGQMRVPAQSLLPLLGILEVWHAEGSPGRPSVFVKRWIDGEQAARVDRIRIGRARSRGHNPVLWPGGDGLVSRKTVSRASRRRLTTGEAPEFP